eukprot:4598244-Ditylum_brightwellii.AAC.1
MPNATEVPEDMFKMSKSGLANMLRFCGLKAGDYKSLPEWFKKVVEKGQNDNTRNQAILLEALQDIIYKDAEICATTELLTTIHNYKWLSNQPVVV